MNDIVTTTPPTTGNPFARVGTGLQQHVSAGAVAIEQERAIAEAQGKLVIAKRFPRDQAVAFQRIMDACSRPGLAEEALYAYPRGGQTVSGPSIRLAEELARCWGNIDYGMKELSRRDGETEMEAYCWDLETNVYSAQKFTVKHLRDKRGGASVLTDERDIYEIGANMGSRRMRARILAVVPGDVVDAAVQRCRDTLAGKTDVPLVDRIRSLTAAFAAIGVSVTLIERRFKKPAAELTTDDLIDLRAIYKALKDGVSKVSDWFGDQTGATAQTATAQAVNAGVVAAAAETVDTPVVEAQPEAVKPTEPEVAAKPSDEFF